MVDDPLRMIKKAGEQTCPWHGTSEESYSSAGILPHDVCPWLYHTVYPYFLGLLYGARFDYNEHGDCHVCCPAAQGVDTVVRKRDNDGSFDPRIGDDMRFVIFAEVVAVNGPSFRLGERAASVPTAARRIIGPHGPSGVNRTVSMVRWREYANAGYRHRET